MAIGNYDRLANRLATLIRKSLAGRQTELCRFSRDYLTAAGQVVVADATGDMTDDELRSLAYRALAAGYQ